MKKFILLLVVGLLFTTSVSAAEFNADLRYGVAKNAEVTKLQKFLTAEKLYSGPITGNFYSLTLKAVKAFQAREKIPTSGLVDALTRAQLNDLIAKRPLDNSVSAPSSAAEFNADLRYGVAKNAEVTKLQKFLTAEKLYSGPITGNFYSLTLKAVKAFQAREKIPTSGLVDALTRAQLNDLIAKRPLDNSVSAPSSAAEFNADLRYGVAKNAEVTKLQKFLTAEKLYSGPITGNFYSLTLKAVKAFQAREKIPTSGLVDALTRAQLNDLIAKRPLDNSVSAPSSAAEFNADLRYGVAKNAEVTKLQKFLTAEKLYSGPITGNFYSLTLKAVKAFQAREKIPTSGLVDALTRAQLNDLIAKRPLDNYVKTPNLFKDNGFEKEFTISDTDVKISKVKPIAGKASLQLSLKNKKVVSLDQTITNLPPSKATVLTMTAEVRPDIKSITNVQLCGVAIYSDKTQASECVTLPKIINKISTISVIVPLV